MKIRPLFYFFALLLSVQVFAGRVDTLAIYSPEMNKTIHSTVVVPEAYYEIKESRFPVLYLLHGYSGDYLSWINLVPRLKDYVDEFKMIVVAPDGGYDSWYLDSPVNEEVRYETFYTKTLIPEVDKRYRTLTDRNYRGIAGLSMGGHGAFYLAIRNKELFGAAASLSGGLDLRPFPANWNLKNVLGEKEEYPENWKEHSVIQLVEHLNKDKLRLFIDIGIADFFLEVNRELHQKLMDLQIDHDYIERPGGHKWDYWRNALPYNLLFFRDFFYSEKE